MQSRYVLTGALAVLLTALAGCGNGTGEPDAVGGPAVMRRLTESQYRATVADIFGPEIPVAARFERALREDGLISIGTGRAGMSPFSIEQYDGAALTVAAAVVGEEHRAKLVPCQPKSGASQFDGECAKRFVEHYGMPLFRRPLRDEEVTRFVEAARAGQDRLGDFYAGLQFALAAMMVSPEFLLRIERPQPEEKQREVVQLDAWSKATRLSYFLTNSTPDEELLRAAGAGELESGRGLQRQVDRLVASPPFEAAVRAFFQDMLQFDKFGDLAKDPLVYPAFNSTVAADAQEQTLRTITHLLIDEKGDYRDLFTTRNTFLTRALGVVYRVPVATRNGWEPTVFEPGKHRDGIQSQVAFLAVNSHPGRSSATLRGKALREVFLCQEVPDPPANVDFAVVQDPSNVAMPTARERLIAHRTEPACAGCHAITDPVGLTLENFDGLGTYRSIENGASIDASGDLDGIAFNSADGLAQALHDHPETPRCLVEKMYRFAVGRDTEMEERPYMDYLNREFKASGYRVPELMRTIALSDNFFAISTVRDAEVE
ncbi:hypothetical protein GCM10011487_26120 [Steroidobacter agaridevorans]|uniref:DUF1592 domain-containing protein n=1 Tax=Steroidobacter agaridevorans TaxID=2695856 RepID=A0A829YD88_9GAMM|nr:DUF1592 domain-containing protein [Steroidobacter agaridevorans]GFE80612.1 hypothetical protein GCM10011487_26120 [Steroidobacter agaridevorans]